MLELSSWFIIGIIYNYFYCYIYSRFNNKEKFKINKTNILICLLISFLYCLVLTFETKEIMVIFKFILTMLLFKIVYNDNLSKLLINSFFIYVIFAIGEMFFAIIFVMLLNIDQTFVQTNFIGIIFANVSILVIVLILINFHFIEKNIVRIIEWYKIKNIPNGGLKGLIHYKIVEMQKKKIKLYIDINENVDNKKINKYLTDNLNDISKIIGVYLDNAREAALKSKEKYIIIEAECNKDKLNFSISNTYKGGINLSKIDNAGYSKKGKNRGYGLSLVHDIISKRDDVEQYREFNGIYFVQHICLKYKK